MAVVIGLYTLPNFGEASSRFPVPRPPSRSSPPSRVEQILTDAKIPNEGVYFEQNGTLGTVRARFTSTDLQLQARDLIDKSLNTVSGDPQYTVAQPAARLAALDARAGLVRPKPMYLGLTCAAACTSCCRWTCRAP